MHTVSVRKALSMSSNFARPAVHKTTPKPCLTTKRKVGLFLRGYLYWSIHQLTATPKLDYPPTKACISFADWGKLSLTICGLRGSALTGTFEFGWSAFIPASPSNVAIDRVYEQLSELGESFSTVIPVALRYQQLLYVESDFRIKNPSRAKLGRSEVMLVKKLR